MASLTDAAMLWGIRSFMDLLGHNPLFTLPEWIAIMGLIAALRLVFMFAKIRSSESFLFDTSANIHNWFLHAVRSLSPSLFHTSDGDSMVEAAYDSTIVLQNNGGVFFQAVQAILQLAIFLPVLLFISWPLTLFLFAVVVPFVAWMQRKIHAMGPEEESLLYAKSKYRADLWNTRRLYRNWSNQYERSAATRHLRAYNRELSKRSLKASVRKNGLSLAMETISVLSMVFVLAFCALLISKNWMSASGLVMFCSAVLLCYKPVKECSRALPQFRSSLSAYRLLVKFGKLPKKAPHVDAGGATLCISDASFSYSSSEAHVFSHFSTAFDGRTPVLLRGKNGSGKSTLLRLLAGLEEWESGQMKYMAKARMQGIFLMAQTLELPPRNMLLEHLTRTKDPAISQFIESANIRKLIRKEGLSGGERSKVGLAWALSSDAYILLLDEPLAAVALDDRAPLLQAFLEAAVKRDKWIVIASHDEIPADLEKNFTTLDLGNVEL